MKPVITATETSIVSLWFRTSILSPVAAALLSVEAALLSVEAVLLSVEAVLLSVEAVELAEELPLLPHAANTLTLSASARTTDAIFFMFMTKILSLEIMII